MNHKKLHKLLADQNIRIFNISLGSDNFCIIHPSKTVSEWRIDVRKFIKELNSVTDNDGYADDEIFNELMSKLHEAGYLEISDIASDVYEGRIAKYKTGIEDDPAHEEQESGFGHYGFESKQRTKQK